MLVSGQWTRQKNDFEITQERTTFFNEKSKKKHVIKFRKTCSFCWFFKTLNRSSKSTSNRGLKMGYFCYILMPMAGIDRVLILMARRKLFSMISLKHTHVVVTYFECNVTFKIKVRMLVYCIDCIFVILL
jgi:hypothetical protein